MHWNKLDVKNWRRKNKWLNFTYWKTNELEEVEDHDDNHSEAAEVAYKDHDTKTVDDEQVAVVASDNQRYHIF